MKPSILPIRTFSPALEDEFPGLNSFRHEMKRLVKDFFEGSYEPVPEWAEPNISRFTPSVDVTETDKTVTVTAELPGLTEKDIDVSLSDGTLILRGEKKEDKEEEAKGHYRMERCYGAFQRAIPLPCEVDKDKVAAVCRNGVITVTLPKTEQAQQEVRKIVVKPA
ncbi:MAG TPA: Hsp20/alpha crystallin family protein [Oculatellaceae cyanobacterium]